MNVLRFDAAVVRNGAFEFSTGTVAPLPGRITVLLGPNGGGKTTALRAAAGLLPATSGNVLLDGQPVHAMAPARRAAAVAMVVQRPQVSAPFTALEVVRLASAAIGAGPCAADEALAQVGMLHRADVRFAELSGGEQQRVAVARAFHQHRPGGVLLLDEAFAAVDPPEAAGIVGQLRRRAEQGATVLLATHDLALASAVADDAWFIAGGGRRFGTARELLAPAELGAFLGIAVAEATGSRGSIAAADLGAAILPRRPE